MAALRWELSVQLLGLKGNIPALEGVCSFSSSTPGLCRACVPDVRQLALWHDCYTFSLSLESFKY